MKECEKLQQMSGVENRKARVERQNALLREKMKEEAPSYLGSAISLSSLSLRTEEDGDCGLSSRNNFSAKSKRPSDILSGYVHSDLPEKDRKILRLMAWRREAKIEEREKAVTAKLIWEKDRLRDAKRSKEKEENLAEYLIRKRQLERIQSLMRKKKKNETLNEEKLILEAKIAEEHERAEIRHKILQDQRLQIQISALNNRTQVQRILKRQKDEEEEAEKVRRLANSEEKIRKSEKALMWLSLEKSRQTRDARRKRELKWLAAKNHRDQLNKEQVEEQMKKLKSQKIREEAQAEKLATAKEWKRKMTTVKNNAKKEQHNILLARVKEEDAQKMDQMREKIREKDSKTNVFREKKETALSLSRCNARRTANLRENIRAFYD